MVLLMIIWAHMTEPSKVIFLQGFGPSLKGLNMWRQCDGGLQGQAAGSGTQGGDAARKVSFRCKGCLCVSSILAAP